MQWPSITAGYLAVLALVYAGLAIYVVRLRGKNRAGFGDAGNPRLRSAIRAHANFAEYVPIIALMVGMLEMSGLPTYRVHFMMAALLVARLLHPLGMHAEPGSLRFRIGRGGGIIITLMVLISSAVLVLSRLARGL
jgi:uncharacterized membrane protein YecN with MAPEG domain